MIDRPCRSPRPSGCVLSCVCDRLCLQDSIGLNSCHSMLSALTQPHKEPADLMPISPGLGVTQVEAFRGSKDKVSSSTSPAQCSLTDSRKDKMELLCQVDVKVVGGKERKKDFRRRCPRWIYRDNKAAFLPGSHKIHMNTYRCLSHARRCLLSVTRLTE